MSKFRTFNGVIYELVLSSWNKNAKQILRNEARLLNRKYRIVPMRENFEIIGYQLYARKE